MSRMRPILLAALLLAVVVLPHSASAGTCDMVIPSCSEGAHVYTEHCPPDELAPGHQVWVFGNEVAETKCLKLAP
jgi:hypothetical protein